MLKKLIFFLLLNKYEFVTMVRKLRQEAGRHVQIPPKSPIQSWSKKFQKKGVVSNQRGQNHNWLLNFYLVRLT